MRIMSWNYSGLGNAKAVSILCELIRAHKPDVIFMFETLVSFSRIEEYRARLGFDVCYVMDCVGQSGGVCAFWRNLDLCTLLYFSTNHIDLEVRDVLHGNWRLTGFYGCPE